VENSLSTLDSWRGLLSCRKDKENSLKWKRKFGEGKFSRCWIAFRWFLPTCHESLHHSRIFPPPPCVCTWYCTIWIKYARG
jgi:hypothetical protein